MPSSFSLDGRTAIVTGGTRGIGLAIAQGFLEQGAQVAICSRKQDGVDRAVAALDAHGGRVLGMTGHVGRYQDLKKIVAATEERFGPVDILVNNAGTNPYYGPILDSDERAWDKTMEINLRAPYLLSRLVGRSMVERGRGSIINVASIGGLRTHPGQGIYSVTKAGLIMLTKVMARELGGHGVRVNCICPGVIKTKLSEAMWADGEDESRLAHAKALGRLGEPDELIGAAVYLASDASSFTTGAVLVVDGGMII